MYYKIKAIVPSAGIGKRFGSNISKPFQKLMGKPLLVWSLEALESVEEIEEIIPVLREDIIEKGADIFEKYKLSKIKRIAQGGEERQDSVYNGLKLIDDKDCIVLIHDGVRPLIEKNLIEKTIKELKVGKGGVEGFDGVVLGVPVKDTIKEAKRGIIKKTLKRDSLWAIQTPQVFPYAIISKVYERSIRDGFYSTDDAALVEKYGGKVKVIMGSYRNIKITTPEDLITAGSLLSRSLRS